MADATGRMTAKKKRQHYVPKFLLRRFAAREGRWQGHIFRLVTDSGRPRPAVPRTEAAKNRYYDLPEDLVGSFNRNGFSRTSRAAPQQRLGAWRLEATFSGPT
jgi:hypothetical protein